MASYIRKLFHKRNKTDAKHGRSVNAAAFWPDDPRTVSASRDIRASTQIVGQRVAGLYLNDPVVRSAVEIIVSMLVGDGVRLKHADAEIAKGFNSRRFDPSEEQSLLSLQRAVARSWAVYGEALALMRSLEGEVSVQMLHPDQLERAKSEDLGNGRVIIAGVEFDEFDRIVAYWILPQSPDDPFGVYRPSQRFEAANVLHIFEREFPGQTRGISPLVSVLPVLNTASIAVDAGLKKLQVAALFTAFLTTPDGSDVFSGDVKPSMEPGATVRLNPGESVDMAEGGEAGDLPAFLKILYRQVAAAIGCTYEDLIGDLEGVNYSSFRGGALTARRKADARRTLLIIDGFLVPLYRRWRAIEALRGNLSVEIEDPEWIEPSWPQVDPMKEAQADIDLVDAGLKSRKEVIEGRGRDFETVEAEIAADTFTPKTAKAKAPEQEAIEE
ncbi:phage portal protein [Martelella lutilitoris]|uniref:Phage portal protein n=1 Tax=Martelella lutilitoris TaxID=2583532 RepID=A0A7T7KNI3_9HYPH|nr:phage portal protein [Martelella lutilitoris]